MEEVTKKMQTKERLNPENRRNTILHLINSRGNEGIIELAELIMTTVDELEARITKLEHEQAALR
jgi:uncharacterized small protein (DUF1192 family)